MSGTMRPQTEWRRIVGIPNPVSEGSPQVASRGFPPPAGVLAGVGPEAREEAEAG